LLSVDYQFPPYTGYIDRRSGWAMFGQSSTRMTVHVEPTAFALPMWISTRTGDDLRMTAKESKQRVVRPHSRGSQTPRHASYMLRFTMTKAA
jgi:hypothetical protein